VSVLVLACGALAREVLAVTRGLEHVEVRCLPAQLHSSPQRIAPAVERELAAAAGGYERVFVAYADCGTVGALDRVLEGFGAERLDGAHCYAAFVGPREWDALQEEEPGTFYLTDFLARHFDALVWRPLAFDRHPDLIDDVFGNYRRLVYLAQTDEPELLARAEDAAERLRLRFEVRRTGYGDLLPTLAHFVQRARAA
jgi:uncharacterized protein DUF1638